MSRSHIDLWWFRLDRDGNAWGNTVGLLSPEERVRYRQFDRPDAARSFAIRRTVRRLILCSYLGVPAEDLRFLEEGGKPVILSPGNELHFSASDTTGMGMIAVSLGAPVGLDIERRRSIRDLRLAMRILSPSERPACDPATPAEWNDLLLRAWTGKEAVVKGMGLGLDLAAFRQITLVPGSEGEAWKAVRLGGSLSDRGSWHVRDMQPECEALAKMMVSVAAPSPRPVRVFEATSLLMRPGAV